MRSTPPSPRTPPSASWNRRVAASAATCTRSSGTPSLKNSTRSMPAVGRRSEPDGNSNGPIAESLVALSDKVGGLFSLDDFRKHTSTWVEPVSTTYRGYEVWEIPPPCQGIATLQMLNLLEPFDIKKMGANSADYWHVFLEG